MDEEARSFDDVDGWSGHGTERLGKEKAAV
jgi:hypothetical protein